MSSRTLEALKLRAASPTAQTYLRNHAPKHKRAFTLVLDFTPEAVDRERRRRARRGHG